MQFLWSEAYNLRTPSMWILISVMLRIYFFHPTFPNTSHYRKVEGLILLYIIYKKKSRCFQTNISATYDKQIKIWAQWFDAELHKLNNYLCYLSSLVSLLIFQLHELFFVLFHLTYFSGWTTINFHPSGAQSVQRRIY